MNELKVFLSSTQLDLAETRQIIIRFLSCLKSDLIAMEFFGSDEQKPVDLCLAQVRECNVFIGIYAARYGQTDPKTRKSITELEYLEAAKMLKAGRLKALLLYVIDPKAMWPLEWGESKVESIKKLADFKKRLFRRHTVSFFKNAGDLPFMILRDVFQKIGISSKRGFKARPTVAVKQQTSLTRPVGMEFYREDLARLFYGRERELNQLEDQLLKYQMSLLIGSSGVGKSSLLCAGLMNRVREMGWVTGYARPLTNPISNLRKFLWSQLLEGDLPPELDFAAVMSAASMAHGSKQVLVIVDQFEDILGARDPSANEEVVVNLLNIFHSARDNLHFLISYRGDVEPQIGAIWQRISGSPSGLPRLYLHALTRDQAKTALQRTMSALTVRIGGSAEDVTAFRHQVLEDLETESRLSGYDGIYPPYMQMVVARVFDDKDKHNTYRPRQYDSAGGGRRIIADYLVNQLRYLGKDTEVGKRLLIALVSSYGTKTQKTLEEISAEAILPSMNAERTLGELIDLRLVRHVDGTYEIAHDFLARLVASELVSAEERETKKFKDLLATRSATYESTHAGLSRSEHLHVYKHRHKFLLTDDEARLLLGSHLSGDGPFNYWAVKYPKPKLAAWTRQLLSEHSDEIEGAAYRFLIKLGEPPCLAKLAETFSDYKRQRELAQYISKFAAREDMGLLIKLNRRRAEEVAHASEEAIVHVVDVNDRGVLEEIGRSRSRNVMLTFERIALNLSSRIGLDETRAGLHSKEPWRRIFSIHCLGKTGTREDFNYLLDLLKSRVPQRIRTAAVKATMRLALRFGDSIVVRTLLCSSNEHEVQEAVCAIDHPCDTVTIAELSKLYRRHPFPVAQAISNLATSRDLPQLRTMLSRMELLPQARELIYALCKCGGKQEFPYLFQLFLSYEAQIVLWNPFAVVDRISDLATRDHLPLLRQVVKTKEFWLYYTDGERPESRIPVAIYENAYFMKRLAGTAYGKVASRREFPIIFRMLSHDYWILQNAALVAIRKYGTADDLAPLVENAIANPAKSDGIIQAIDAIDDKIAAACNSQS